MNTSIRQGIHEYDSQVIQSVDMKVNNVLALIFVNDVLALISKHLCWLSSGVYLKWGTPSSPSKLFI
jgi:hypothetical protein